MAKTITNNEGTPAVTIRSMRTPTNQDAMAVEIIYNEQRMEMTMRQAITLARDILYLTGAL